MRLPVAIPVLTAILTAFLPLAAWQEREREPHELTPSANADVKLPNGKSQREEILKADYDKTLKDAAQLVELAQALQQEIEKDDRHVLSIASLKKTDEIEKLAKRIRSRMRRF